MTSSKVNKNWFNIYIEYHSSSVLKRLWFSLCISITERLDKIFLTLLIYEKNLGKKSLRCTIKSIVLFYTNYFIVYTLVNNFEQFSLSVIQLFRVFSCQTKRNFQGLILVHTLWEINKCFSIQLLPFIRLMKT